jgi:hypothetical protein
VRCVVGDKKPLFIRRPTPQAAVYRVNVRHLLKDLVNLQNFLLFKMCNKKTVRIFKLKIRTVL